MAPSRDLARRRARAALPRRRGRGTSAAAVLPRSVRLAGVTRGGPQRRRVLLLSAALLQLLLGGARAAQDALSMWARPPPVPLSGTTLPRGAPLAIVGSELESDDAAKDSWAGKNSSALTEFVELRLRYLGSDEAFSTFRTLAHMEGRAGCDAQYGELHPDTGRMLAVMEESRWGQALLAATLPLVASRIDGFGSPRYFAPGRHRLMSPDLFSSLFKLSLLLQSFGDFAAVPGQPNLPELGDLYSGPSLAPLLMHWDVIEVGAGPGFFASTFVAGLNANTYSIVDLPTQQAFQYKVLRSALGDEKVNGTFVFVPCCPSTGRMYAEFTLPKYDLFVSHSSLGELSVETRERYFYAFIVRCKRGFLIDNYEDIHATREGGVRDGAFVRTGDGGRFIGMDLVWRLQDLGFDVRVRTHQEVLGVVAHRSRALVITWASVGLEDLSSLGLR